MKHQILILIAAVLTTATSAQEILSSGGDSLEGNGVMLDFTIGELATETLEGQVTLTQGFHQSQLSIVAVQELESISFQAYPNPTSDLITFDLSQMKTVQAINILDLSGRVVLHVEGGLGSFAVLNLSQLSRGAYLAQIITQQSSNSSSILIQKL